MTRDVFFTAHAKFKMRYYKLSESRVKSILRNPERTEEGIAENTVAMMQTNKTSNKPYEVWVMVSRSNVLGRTGKGQLSLAEQANVRIVSAWKYPGQTKPGEPLPKAILKEFREAA